MECRATGRERLGLGTKKFESSHISSDRSDHCESGSLDATNIFLGSSTSTTQSSSNYLPEVATGEGSKFASEVESAIKRGFFATTGDRDRAMKRMTLEERRQYREAHAKQWGYDLGNLLGVSD